MLGVEALTQAVQALLDHHDALRLQLTRSADEDWTLIILPRGSIAANLCVARIAVH